MRKLDFLKIVLAYLSIVALVCYLHMLMFGKESTINAMLACVISGSTIGLYIIVGFVLCAAIYMIATGREEKKPVNPNAQEKTTLADVIVSDELKKDLKVIFGSMSEQMRENFKILGLTPAKGYLFHGPPGTGKTLLARAIAGEANIHFINISAPMLAGKYAKEGIRLVHNLFEQARKNAPCIIFIDEIDSIGAKRTSNSSSVSQDHNKTLMQLLTEIDGFDSSEGITVIAATNRPEALDEALLRRFHEKINISLPDLISREKILRLQMGSAPAELGLSLEEVAKKTEGYSGDDLKNLVRKVKLRVAKCTEVIVTMDDFNNVLEKLKIERQKPKDKEAEVKVESMFNTVLVNTIFDMFHRHAASQNVTVHGAPSN